MMRWVYLKSEPKMAVLVIELYFLFVFVAISQTLVYDPTNVSDIENLKQLP